MQSAGVHDIAHRNQKNKHSLLHVVSVAVVIRILLQITRVAILVACTSGNRHNALEVDLAI